MTTQHTPGPWKRENHWITDLAGLKTIAIMPVVSVADLAVSPAANLGAVKNEADAEYIVQACNSHYELLKALRDCLTETALRNETRETYLERIKAINTIAQSAIAKAEKGGAL